jgi:tripartite-type tricarboxylate transporter receptor subunit TctC
MANRCRQVPGMLVLLLAAAGAWAQAYPAKPVRVVIGAAPGSNMDFFFRVVSNSMSATLGQQLVADYRPGGGGIVGAAAAAKASPDGYLIGFVGSGFNIHPAMVKSLPYDSLRDFTTLGLVVDVPQAMVIHPSLPAKNLKELLALARSRPGQLNFGSSGPGTNSHLAGVLLNLLAKVNIVHVPYKSTPPMLIDLMSGQIEMTFPSIPGVVEHVRSGRMRMLAQTGQTRSVTAPEVPTMEEAGLKGFFMNSGFGFVGPANLPRAVIDRINAAMVKALQDPAIRKQIVDSGADPVGGAPDEHASFNRNEVARWVRVAQEAGIKPE